MVSSHNFKLSTVASKMFTQILSVCTTQFNICRYLDLTANETRIDRMNTREVGMIIDILWATESDIIGGIAKMVAFLHDIRMTKFIGGSGGDPSTFLVKSRLQPLHFLIRFFRSLTINGLVALDSLLEDGSTCDGNRHPYGS